jgi:CheY-like chemotaxis protein
MNLAVNARDAMAGGGVLTIRVAAADPERGVVGQRYALLSVTDEGSGIDAATASLIFEPFFTTKGERGTGLGLATVHGIVAQTGGQIVLETELGLGSTFKVYLPLSAEQIPPPAAPPVATSGEGSETILLIEDDPAVRSMVAMMLAARGYAIVEAADGEQAIACFEASDGPIHLVVSDLMMRGLDGQQTTDRIRAIEPSTRVLYMSGYTDDAITRSGGLGHETSFIQKPFSGNELGTRVRELLDGR